MKINDSLDLFVNFENDFNEEFFGILNHQWGVENGGCVEDNVSIKENSLVLDACGNLYDGPIKGLNHDKTKADNGKKTGAGLLVKIILGQEALKF